MYVYIKFCKNLIRLTHEMVDIERKGNGEESDPLDPISYIHTDHLQKFIGDKSRTQIQLFQKKKKKIHLRLLLIIR